METADKNIVNIYLESNPNPNSMKFVANFMLVPEGNNYDFPDPASTQGAPLAKELFGFSYVTRVFYMSNFVTVTKTPEVEWAEVQNEVKTCIKDYLESGQAILIEEPVSAPKEAPAATSDTELDQKIKEILEEYVKPAVEQDGGAISFLSYQDGIVNVQLQGSCSGCPSSMITLKAGIENLLKKMIPEIEGVEAQEV